MKKTASSKKANKAKYRCECCGMEANKVDECCVKPMKKEK